MCIKTQKLAFAGLLVFFGALESCSSNNWLVPEKTANPKIQDKFKTVFEKDKWNPDQYEKNENIVRSQDTPGKLVSQKPDPALHQAKKSDDNNSSDSVKTLNDSSNSGKKKSMSYVYYTGNELFRGKENVKKTGREDLTTIMKGAAAVRYEQMLMKSAEIRIIGAENDYVISEVPLTIDDYKSNTTLNAGYGEFIRSENRAYFNKKPWVVHLDKKTGEKTTLASDEMDRFFNLSITRAYGHVRIFNADTTAYSAKATYYEDEEKILLEGNPVIYEKKNIYIADKMTLFKDKKIAILEGDVRILLTEEKKGSPEMREVKTLVTGDYAEYRYGGQVKVAEVQSKRKDSFVYVSRKDSETYCDHLIARGENLDEMELFEKIYILDRENRTRLYGEYGNYSKQDQRTKMFTRNNKEGILVHPVVVFYNKKDEITGTMTSEILDRDLEKKMTYARGNVVFQLFEKNEKVNSAPKLQSLAKSEWSEMEDEKKIIFMLGSPYLQKDQNQIRAAQIAIYPDDNRLELLNSIKGVISN